MAGLSQPKQWRTSPPQIFESEYCRGGRGAPASLSPETAFQTDHPQAGAWLPSPVLRDPWKSCLLAALSFSNCNQRPGEQGARRCSCLAR